MDNNTQNCRETKRAFRRALSLLLALCLSLTLLPALPQRARAADADDADAGDQVRQSLDTLVDWGVMRGDSDGGLHPDRSLTRAEFVAMVNRAYGYDEKGSIPFNDVPVQAWYADDIAIAYNAGYFLGTGNNQAKPLSTLTREEAVVLLARSLRLKEVPGQAVELSDGNAVSDWSRGYVRAAAQMGLVDDDGGKGFRPKDTITRGEMAALLAGSVGNLVQTGGEHELGSVYGNLTINKAGTTLKNTVVAGDLYVTGGVGLGGVTLENVTVLGQIVVAGGGESEKGEDSLVLRNVEAENLVVDSLRGQYTSLRAEGDTSIQDTVLRTSGFVQDRTDSGYGLLNVALDAAAGSSFSLSGNLKDVVNKTPGSSLVLSNGTAASLTVDEKATGSSLRIEPGAVAKKLNLDGAAAVTGKGDIDKLQVNAAGSSIEALPDTVAVRPGLEASVSGSKMDNKLAQESSADPRLLAGYPRMKSVAPTSATGVFSTNKAGTVYWAVSSTTSGSLSEEELLGAKTSAKAIKQGSLNIKSSNTETNVNVTGLTRGGDYYLSAMLVDARGKRSPVKVVSFSTPDDTVPNFATGYPTMVKITNIAAQAGVMTTKDCILHYALFPKGAAAPTANDFKTGALSGALGRGTREMTRSVTEYFYINSRDLEELKSYDAYFWLTDADGAKSSAVRKVSFSTVDRTPPVITSELRITSYKATSLSGTATVNEAGTLYWAVVPAGTEFPTRVNGVAATLDSMTAKVAVANGTNATRNGKVTVRADTQATINITRLKAESSYDIYYVAQDKAGNYSEVVKVLADVHTLDTNPPTAEQAFDHFPEGGENNPFADTSVDIIFSETVQQLSSGQKLLDLYAAGDTATLASILSKTIQLYSTSDTTRPVPEREYDSSGQPVSGDDWVIDYRKAQIEMDPTDTEGRRMIVHFWGKAQDQHEPALNLRSGSTYYFKLTGLADTASSPNKMGDKTLPRFTTTTAQVVIRDLNQTAALTDISGNTILAADQIHMPFELLPQSTSSVESNTNWDLIFWSKSSVDFEVYYKTPEGGWQKTLQDGKIISDGTRWNGVSFQKTLMGQPQFDTLNSLLESPYLYTIHVTAINGEPLDENSKQNELVQFKIQAVSGNQLPLDNQTLQNGTLGNGVTDITSPRGGYEIEKQFVDQAAPSFVSGFPRFVDIQDETMTIQVRLSDRGKLYYVLAPVGTIGTRDTGGDEVQYSNPDVPSMTAGGSLQPADSPFLLSTPNRYLFTNKDTYDGVPDVIVGSPFPMSVGTNKVDIPIKSLKPNTQYFAYFLIDGDNALGDQVLLYKFETQDVIRPVIELSDAGNPTVSITSNINATVQYALVTNDDTWLYSLLKTPFCQVIPGYNPDASGVAALYQIPTKYQSYFNAKSSTYLADSFTVLDALKADITDGLNSIGCPFDLFAGQTYKDDMANYIRASGTLPPEACAGTGSTSLVKNVSKTVKCGEKPFTMEDYPVTYCFLVVGRSSSSAGGEEASSKDAFRAIFPITKITKETPTIIGVNAMGLTYDKTHNTVSGTFSLTFEKQLYFLGTSDVGFTGSKVVDLGPYTDSKRTESTYVSIMALLQSSSSSSIEPVVKSSAVNKSTTRIEFQVTGASLGDSALFYPGFCDRTGTDVNRASLEVRVVLGADGKPTVTIPADWNGTGHPEFTA